MSGTFSEGERDGVRYILRLRAVFILYADSQSLLFPPVPCKAVNALGFGRRPEWVRLSLGIDDL